MQIPTHICVYMFMNSYMWPFMAFSVYFMQKIDLILVFTYL